MIDQVYQQVEDRINTVLMHFQIDKIDNVESIINEYIGLEPRMFVLMFVMHLKHINLVPQEYIVQDQLVNAIDF